jgi:hypothetical protein
MIILTPVPAWVATLTNTVQKQKMKATDGRVQTVTESTSSCSPTLHECNLTNHLCRATLLLLVMSVLRMIKLFGWEGRVRETVAEKREEELKWIWKKKLLGLASSIAKWVNFFGGESFDMATN